MLDALLELRFASIALLCVSELDESNSRRSHVSSMALGIKMGREGERGGERIDSGH